MNTGKRLNCVVLLDDNEAHNYYHQFEFEQANCADEIVSFLDPDKAMKFLTERHQQNNTPDLLLLDCNMPNMQGVQFLQKLRQVSHDFIDHMKIIMLSATEVNNVEELKQKGITAFKVKPVDQRAIQSILSTYF